MGDLQAGSRQPNGVVAEDCPFLMASLTSNPDPLSIGEGSLGIAEKMTQEVLCCIHPTLDSEEKRKDVIEYIQRLIRLSIGCEVFPYGSVPLKTYLPDGDIDLTALCTPDVEETLARDVLAVLQREEQNANAEYEVKDTQFIDAEVKLVKCLVQNIVIDVSFSQLGGLCTLCFLEQVDRLVGRDHLFKRSIILIKAWCYYESRILGAHHGLISTYALETLILYIFHLFHTSLNGPLAVLYKFLDYFSKFDWDNYCISLKGPVPKSSLPDIVVEMPVNLGDNLMFSEEFLRNCMDIFSVPSRMLDTNLRAFPQKHLNIIDPLKENNNLGRSVNRGNYYRIRSAFKYGARKLGRILLLPRERIANEIKRFFANTLERHGHSFSNVSSSSHSRTFSEESIQLNLNLDLDNNKLEERDNEPDRYWRNGNSINVASKMARTVAGNGEASLRIADDTSNGSPSSHCLGNSLYGLNYHAPHFYFSGFSPENGNLENGYLNEEKMENVDEKMGFDLWTELRENDLNHEDVSSSGSGISSPVAAISDGPLDFRERDLAHLGDIAGIPETLIPLSDLSGDYDSHIRSLLYGQCCHGYALSAPVLPNSLHQSILVKQNASSQIKTNGAVRPPQSPINNPISYNSCSCLEEMVKPPGTGPYPDSIIIGLTHENRTNNPTPSISRLCLQEKHRPQGTGTYFPDSIIVDLTHENPMNNSTPSNSRLCLEEKHKPRGTGKYFPDTNGCSCREKSSQPRGRNHAPGNQRQSWRQIHSNGSEKVSLSREKSGLSHQSTRSSVNDSNGGGFSIPCRKIEFGSLGQLPEQILHSASGPPSLVVRVQSSKEAVLGGNEGRVARQSFVLKNEDDFPPLKLND
ncbi:uncharacterized protein LOC131298289 isoform X1 [Rhododendron vialii]|uniref:uncharacterized protein LOC131298289 isoform X1 n=1 Tax=Rhododendron vialii TaxID=182163 RepID=UPI00265FE5E0|nr:uncharacterized protein LOC131298289 isoform X1 [Rhododendron vialii]